MTRLEERYRRVLRLLPASYRLVREEEMVAAFLDSMATGDPEDADHLADYGRPSWSEVASVAALAVRLRFGHGTGSPRAAAWNEAFRLAALMAMLYNAAFVGWSVVTAVWISDSLPAPPPALALGPAAEWPVTAAILGHPLWPAAYVALVLGRARIARQLALWVVALDAISATIEVARGMSAGPTRWGHLLFNLVLVLTLAAFGPHPGPRARRPWLAALAVAIVVGVLIPWLSVLNVTASLLLDWPATACVTLVVAATVHLATRARRPASWTLAFAVLALAVLGLRLITLVDYAELTPAWAGPAEALAVAAVTLPLVRLASRTLHRLPEMEKLTW